METSMLGLASFPCYTPPNRSLPKFRILSMRQQYPLASKIVVKNLPYFTGENTLQKEFSDFGKIVEVKIVKDAITERSKGFAYIQYTSQDDAMLALENMDQKSFHGRKISVKLVKLRPYDMSGPSPRASGPPKKWNIPEKQEEDVVDCWY
ncbi:unnamed protein product [Vicia faba]|uniref:RRM domain-containing protein n=1 Tax=Vicia faba TaxID=3906 RepID=A0AAV0YJ66_VICFA|nr:unnamed protein product [Vicia faba]